MEKIWHEEHLVYEGPANEFTSVVVKAWWDHETGTTRIEFWRRGGNRFEPFPDTCIATELGTYKTREQAVRSLITALSVFIAHRLWETKETPDGVKKH